MPSYFLPFMVTCFLLSTTINLQIKIAGPIIRGLAEIHQMAVVVHDQATKDAISDVASRKRYGIDNPNFTLLKALMDRGTSFLIGYDRPVSIKWGRSFILKL